MNKKRIISIFFFVIPLLVLLYAWQIETQWIEINHFQIKAPVSESLKIMQISDLHTKGLNAPEKKVLTFIESEKPDIILLTGDISSPGSDLADYESVLKNIKAPKGVYFVTGNWEYWVHTQGFNELLVKLGIENLDNKNKLISGNTWLIGFDDVLEGNPDEKRAFQDVPADSFKLGIFHTPQYFDLIHQKLDLSLAGHSHGGQMRLPFMKPFWLPAGTGEYVDGWFSKGKSRMYVSRGIGNSILPLRFFCRPEIAVFNLSKN